MSQRPLPSSDTLRLVLTTVDREESAQGLAEGLIHDGLAACVSILGPVRSYYVWQGALQRDKEWLLLVKTDEPRLGALLSALTARHPYDVPEILTLSSLEADARYAQWVKECLERGGAP